ncbi:hypothetical protein INR49_014204 [Caranx melampygus]|nr:hypothetical protein INR49_014546 [Caranx melampygus]KAG7243212.1 hypothetical protein INR49_014204 [Caranx melampygus]
MAKLLSSLELTQPLTSSPAPTTPWVQFCAAVLGDIGTAAPATSIRCFSSWLSGDWSSSPGGVSTTSLSGDRGQVSSSVMGSSSFELRMSGDVSPSGDSSSRMLELMSPGEVVLGAEQPAKSSDEEGWTSVISSSTSSFNVNSGLWDFFGEAGAVTVVLRVLMELVVLRVNPRDWSPVECLANFRILNILMILNICTTRRTFWNCSTLLLDSVRKMVT